MVLLLYNFFNIGMKEAFLIQSSTHTWFIIITEEGFTIKDLAPRIRRAYPSTNNVCYNLLQTEVNKNVEATTRPLWFAGRCLGSAEVLHYKLQSTCSMCSWNTWINKFLKWTEFARPNSHTGCCSRIKLIFILHRPSDRNFSSCPIVNLQLSTILPSIAKGNIPTIYSLLKYNDCLVL